LTETIPTSGAVASVGGAATGPGAAAADELLRVVDLKTWIYLRQGIVKAVDGVSFSIRRGESVGLVGESGSGKTITCLSVMRLMPVPSAHIVGGEVWFGGRDLLAQPESEMRTVRGRQMAMIMQDPLAALNPILSIGEQVGEPLRYHTKLGPKERLKRVIETLGALRIPHPEERLGEYPHQFSGGMRQRIVAAMGISTSPSLIIADEPTTALDVTIQGQFLALMRELRAKERLSVLWVTHDLGVVAQVCDRVNVMYAGRIVESGDVRRIFASPAHPYTRSLMASVPVLGNKQKRLYQIEGQPPNLLNLPPGCPFYDRCPLRMDICRDEYPAATPIGDGFVHCWAVSPPSTSGTAAGTTIPSGAPAAAAPAAVAATIPGSTTGSGPAQ
jgi:oligopeptide/dipeptide ABC transporter ATP-binding protein